VLHDGRIVLCIALTCGSESVRELVRLRRAGIGGQRQRCQIDTAPLHVEMIPASLSLFDIARAFQFAQMRYGKMAKYRSDKEKE
jgi:hypothetical protein